MIQFVTDINDGRIEYTAPGSGSYTLCGSSAVAQTGTAALPAQTAYFQAAFVTVAENPKMFGSINVKWAHGDDLYRLSLRLSPGSGGLGPDPNLRGVFFYNDGSYLASVNLSGFYTINGVSTPVSGGAVVFAIGQSIASTMVGQNGEPLGYPADSIGVVFGLNGGPLNMELAWVSATTTPPFPFTVVRANSFLLAVKLV
jgi:hypothetical protein